MKNKTPLTVQEALEESLKIVVFYEELIEIQRAEVNDERRKRQKAEKALEDATKLIKQKMLKNRNGKLN